MPYAGTLKKVFDNEKGWGIIIDVDEYGDKTFKMWDKTLAGEASKEHEAVCDVHDMIGERVMYSAKKGNLKDKNDPDGERWPPVIESIWLEADEIPDIQSLIDDAPDIDSKPSEIDSTPEPVKEPVDDKYDRQRALTMDMLNAIGKWAAGIEQLTKGE